MIGGAVIDRTCAEIDRSRGVAISVSKLWTAWFGSCTFLFRMARHGIAHLRIAGEGFVFNQERRPRVAKTIRTTRASTEPCVPTHMIGGAVIDRACAEIDLVETPQGALPVRQTLSVTDGVRRREPVRSFAGADYIEAIQRRYALNHVLVRPRQPPGRHMIAKGFAILSS